MNDQTAPQRPQPVNVQQDTPQPVSSGSNPGESVSGKPVGGDVGVLGKPEQQSVPAQTPSNEPTNPTNQVTRLQQQPHMAGASNQATTDNQVSPIAQVPSQPSTTLPGQQTPQSTATTPPQSQPPQTTPIAPPEQIMEAVRTRPAPTAQENLTPQPATRGTFDTARQATQSGTDQPAVAGAIQGVGEQQTAAVPAASQPQPAPQGQQYSSQAGTPPVSSTTQQPAELVGGDKERVEIGTARHEFSELAGQLESQEHAEFEPEVEGWLEKVKQGHEVQLPEPVTHEGEVVVADAGKAVSDDVIVLPLTQQQVQKGTHEQVTSGARWLAEWCMRLIKMFGNQVQYKQSQPEQ